LPGLPVVRHYAVDLAFYRAVRDLLLDVLWGLFGTFIGVPIALAILSFCSQHPSSRWLAELLGGPKQTKTHKI